MRPEVLFPLFAPTSRLPGIGPRLEKLLEKPVGAHVIDLCWHLPFGLIDRRNRPHIAQTLDGEIATLQVNVGSHIVPRNKKMPYRVHVSDETGDMQLIFFRPRQEYLQKVLPEGSQRIISGRVEYYQGEPQMSHPDHIVSTDNTSEMPLIEPIYHLTAGVSLKVMSKAVRGALELVPELPEWQEQHWLTQENFPSWKDALTLAHAPESESDLAVTAPARARLAYDELLASQLALGLVRTRMRGRRGRATKGDGRLRDQVLKALPFKLTSSQTMALAEIYGDMSSGKRMLRLLQGDVGSGKTLVALMAMLNAVETGAQGAMMAPTEILARQHGKSLTPLCEAAGIRLEVLTGREKGKKRQALLEDLKSGDIDVLIGTHAIFEGDVDFKNLALAVVDEQHRFGVHQRLQLSTKGGIPADVLVMTATPIPRTLSLTHYGDMDVTRLMEKPVGRQPIATRALPLTRLDEVVEAVGRALTNGARVYWVCPLVEESEHLDVAAVEDRAIALRDLFGDKVGLVHGRMKAAEKDETMSRFQSGALTLLVATTVIEVGVDVPEATIMVIEHAERFGLAQLHQLRGRVGRGTGKSSCLLLYHGNLGETAKARINILRETEDGFVIAEEDLKLRGAGEVLGTRQSGLPDFRLADPVAHANLLVTAHDDVRLILGQDPELKTERGKALRTLLYLFERDDAIRYLDSG